MTSSTPQPLTAFINFPSPYTQTLLVKALVSTLDSISISLLPPDDADPPRLQWADYDLLSLDVPHANPSTHLISSYIYRKALIRKHQLHLTITEYLAKCEHRGVKSILRPSLPPGDARHGMTNDGDESESRERDDLRGGTPRGWVVDVQFADELDELLMDDLYELADGMRNNEELEDGEKQWYILKPGFADRAQGIRMFSTEDELRAIFESFEPPSSDEGDSDYDNDDDDDDDDESDQDEGQSTPLDGPKRTGKDVDDGETAALSGALQKGRISDSGMNGIPASSTDGDHNDADDGNIDEDEEEGGTGVVMSQLRHFVIQEYMPRPMLFDITQTPGDAGFEPISGNKFHLRAYVLLSGDYELYLSRTLLALFSADAYAHPSSAAFSIPPDPDAEADGDTSAIDMDAALRPHLTNTCLQTDAYGALIREEGLVKLFWELEGMDALHLPTSARGGGDAETDFGSNENDQGSQRSRGEGQGRDVESKGRISQAWLDKVFERVGMVLDESVKAGVECGSFGLQLMPNAFEIFGVDLLLSYPPTSPSSAPSEPPIPIVTLLEYNASPDFHQSGNRLQADILDMFKGVVRGVVAPFFGLDTRDEDTEGGAGDDRGGKDGDEATEKSIESAWEVGQEKWGWRKVGQGQVRGPTV